MNRLVLLLLITAELSAITLTEFDELMVNYILEQGSLSSVIQAYKTLSLADQPPALEKLRELLGPDEFKKVQSSFAPTQAAAVPVSAAVPAQPNLDEFKRLIENYNQKNGQPAGVALQELSENYRRNTDPTLRAAMDEALKQKAKNYDLIRVIFEEIKQPRAAVPARAQPANRL